MRMILQPVLMALLMMAAPALSAGAVHAAPVAAAAVTTAQVNPVLADTAQAASGSLGVVPALSASTPTPSPGDTASTGPANPGTGESGQNEATRLDFAPWVIGAVALVTLIVVLIWWRRRNTTIV